MKKGCLIAVGVFVALIVGVVVLAFTLTGGAASAANDFLGKLGAGKISEAYAETSATLKSQQTLEVFEESVKQLGLTDYSSASWSNRSVDNGRGKVEGTVTTRAGGKIPLAIDLVKESGGWKVFALHAPEAGVSAEHSSPQIPTNEQQKSMALATLLAFNQAVKDKSFVAFHKESASQFREQISAEKLLEIFKKFVDENIDISSIEKVQPAFDAPPALDSDGVLILKGSYPVEPNKVVFELKYVYQDGAWKLLGINVKIPTLTAKDSAPSQSMPSEAKLQQMVHDSLMAFNKAVLDKSFAAFHEGCASQFREQVSVEQMDQAFKKFVDNKVDISLIEKASPVFDAPPEIDSDGVLIAKGGYPTDPKVLFELKYISDAGAWKILAINVNLPTYQFKE